MLLLFVPISSSISATNNPIISLAKTVVEKAKKRYIIRQSARIAIVVDFTKPNTSKRLYVVDVYTNRILFSTYVAHGEGSGQSAYPTRFSNIINSHMSSIGVFKPGSRYYGGNGLSISLYGLEFTNSNAYKRRIVVHGATYAGKIDGFSWGCFAVPYNDITELYSYINTQTLIIAYYPDGKWLDNSRFLN